MTDSEQLRLEMIADAQARRMLEALGEPLTVSELAEACSMPKSTTYRKIDKLQAAGLVETKTRVARSGSHPTAYKRSVDKLEIRLGRDGAKTNLSMPASPE